MADQAVAISSWQMSSLADSGLCGLMSLRRVGLTADNESLLRKGLELCDVLAQGYGVFSKTKPPRTAAEIQAARSVACLLNQRFHIPFKGQVLPLMESVGTAKDGLQQIVSGQCLPAGELEQIEDYFDRLSLLLANRVSLPIDT
jgi:hypothetical protein